MDRKYKLHFDLVSHLRNVWIELHITRWKNASQETKNAVCGSTLWCWPRRLALCSFISFIKNPQKMSPHSTSPQRSWRKMCNTW